MQKLKYVHKISPNILIPLIQHKSVIHQAQKNLHTM